jgi:hypothetical protein
MALSDRSAKNGQFKIVTAVDFPRGQNYALDKFKSMEPVALSVDGMDILLTPGRTQIETSNEMKAMSDFVKGAVNPLVGIRYVVGCYSGKWKDVERIVELTKQNPSEIIRMDQNLRPPNVNTKKHIDMMNLLKNITPKVLKVSGNVGLSTIEEVLKIDNRTIFDVDIRQAIEIVNQIKDRDRNQPKSPTEKQ